jgi:hypothetical protein
MTRLIMRQDHLYLNFGIPYIVCQDSQEQRTNQRRIGDVPCLCLARCTSKHR